MKILLFGKNGQVGWELARSLAPLGELTALGSDDREPCGDLADPDGIVRTIQSLAPDVIVNAAAYTAVDQAESETDRAHLINAQAPAALARTAAQIDALLVHYSTDYVFDGSGSTPWVEGDPARPCNAYGATKAEGDRCITDAGCRYLIFRTSWVYAARGQNFVRTMIRLAAERAELKVVSDQWGAPTGAELIADVTACAITAVGHSPERCGTYHLAAHGETCWHSYAGFVIDQARKLGLQTSVEQAAILPIQTAEFETAAPRPLNSRLATSRLQRSFNLVLPDWRSGVLRAVTEIMNR